MRSDLLSPQQAAKLVGVSKVALWKARQRGEIRAAAMTSRGALYSRQEITEWKALRKRRQQQRGKAPLSLNHWERPVGGWGSIQSVHENFSWWHRRMGTKMLKWGEPEISKALDLLSPIMKLWCELDERHKPFREKRQRAEEQARKRRELATLSAVSD